MSELNADATVAVISQHLEALEQQIARLKQTLDIVTNTALNARKARAVLEELESQSEANELLLLADPSAHAVLRVKPLGAKPLVYIGLNIYAECTLEFAKKQLERREKLLEEQAKTLRARLEELAREYERLQGLAQAAIERSVARTEAGPLVREQRA